MTATLSVIIANYNHAEFLPGALEAFMGQTRPADEIIVVDDASTDNSLEVLDTFKKRMPNLIVIACEKNQGTLAASAIGTAAARGTYLYLAGADDRVAPRLVEATLDILQQHPTAGLCCGKGAFFGDTDRVWNGYVPCETSTFFPPPQVAEVCTHPLFEIPSWTIVFRRDVFLKWGGLQSDLAWNCDWFAAYLCAFDQGLCFVPEVLGNYRLERTAYGAKSVTNQQEQVRLIQAILCRLAEAKYDPVRPLFEKSGIIGRFPHALKAAATSGQVRWLTSPRFVKNALVTWTRLHWKGFLPASLIRVLRKSLIGPSKGSER